MFAPSRDQARQFFFDTWKKYRASEALSALEQVALAVISLHPEYHALLEDTDRNLDRDYTPAEGGINPFLHLSLHLAIAEQLSIDQPRGIAVAYRELAGRTASPHDALHALLECLGEIVWLAQRGGTAPDELAYLDCIRRTLR